MMLQRTRPESCLSDLALDRLLAGELAGEREAAARDHLTGCDLCAGRLEALTADRERFRAAPPAIPALTAAARRPARRRSAMWPAVAAAVAMAAALVLWWRIPSDDGEAGGTRIKGTSHLSFSVKRDGAVSAGASGDPMYAGDLVRFSVRATAPGFAVVASVDGAGQVSVYYPDGDRATAVEPGVTTFPGSIELDDTPGRETVFGFMCADPVPVERVRAALASPEPALAGCQVDRVIWDKRPR